MLQDYFVSTATVKRLTNTGDPDIEELTTVGTIKCDIQQVGAEEAVLAGGTFGRVYKLFCNRTEDIKHADRIEADSKVFDVKGVLELKEGGIDHLEVILIETLS